MRIAIIQSGLSAGGAEKIVNLLAHHRAILGDEVHVLVFGGTRGSSYFEYADNVSILSMRGSAADSGNPALRFGRRVAWLRTQIRSIRPDLIISFLTKTNVMTLLACTGLGVPVVISERNNPYRQDGAAFWRSAILLLQPRSALLVMQTETARRELGASLLAKSVVIPNPATVPSGVARRKEFKGNVVAVGRLTPQKGFDLLLAAFALVTPLVQSTNLTIFGEGPERSNLMLQAKELGISERVSFPGTTAQPGDWLNEADIFVLSSRYEGFPNVLVEAVSAGLPCIAFSCPWGPTDILTNERNGLLVAPENVPKLATAIVKLLKDEKLRDALAEATLEIAQRYDLTKVLRQWDEAIASARR
ncbi:MAG: glycosyltransferase family 4 protein [Aestuariivirga sp.]